jgi:hypothetical protein
MSYDIETDIEEATVTILSDDDSILDNEAAMNAVGAAVIRDFGAGCETVGKGSSYFDSRGREAGWTWSVQSAALRAMVAVLQSHGERFAGNNPADEAQDWLDHGFSAAQAEGWCEAGFWDAATAAAMRDAGVTAQDAAKAAEAMIEEIGDGEAGEKYTDGDPIYAACNNDLSPDEIIAVARR